MDLSGSSRAPRKPRPASSLKAQAIGWLSRREHSRQELRAKLLAAIRQREREAASLVAAEAAHATNVARALRGTPANGIDDAFAPRDFGRHDAGDGGTPDAASEMGNWWDDAAGGDEGGFTARSRPVGLGRPAGGKAPASRHGLEADGRAPRAGKALAGLRFADGRAAPAGLVAGLGRAVAAGEAAGPRDAGGLAAPAGPAVQSQRTSAGSDRRAAHASHPAAIEEAPVPQDDPETEADRLLDWLEAHGYLSDTRFVESRVHARSAREGTMRIKHELARHGLALDAEQAQALRETEFARAQAIWLRKFGEPAADVRERAKQARFLAARGFAADIVRRIVGGRDDDN